MVVWLPATLEEPGLVLHHAAPVHGILDVGRYPAGSDTLIETVASDLGEAGYCAEANPMLMRFKHAKLLANLHTGLLGVCGLDGADPSYTKRMRAEADACYRAAGIDAASKEEEDARRAACEFSGGRIEGRHALLGSVYQSLMRSVGTIETDFIHGEIVLLGAMHGVATPYCRALQRAAKEMANQKQRPGAYSVADLERVAREEFGAA
jgi:2-dehydropantoate 2-reductase